jgi:hypothetical protein
MLREHAYLITNINEKGVELHNPYNRKEKTKRDGKFT